MSKRVTVQFPDWMIKDLLEKDDNDESLAERVRELVVKGSKYEDLQTLAGVNDLHRYVASASLDKEKQRSGPDGSVTPLHGLDDDNGGFHKTGVVGTPVAA